MRMSFKVFPTTRTLSNGVRPPSLAKTANSLMLKYYTLSGMSWRPEEAVNSVFPWSDFTCQYLKVRSSVVKCCIPVGRYSIMDVQRREVIWLSCMVEASVVHAEVYSTVLLLDQHVRTYAMAYSEFTHLVFAIISSTGALSTPSLLHRLLNRCSTIITRFPFQTICNQEQLVFSIADTYTNNLLTLNKDSDLQSTQISPVATTTSFPHCRHIYVWTLSTYRHLLPHTPVSGTFWSSRPLLSWRTIFPELDSMPCINF